MGKHCSQAAVLRLRALVLLGAVLLLLLSAAVLPAQTTEADAADDSASSGETAQAEDYQIGSGDVLSIMVFGYDELKTKARVSENGSIEFPLIGSVQVGGLKTSAAARKINELLADGYIVRPQTQIYIEEFRSKKVIVLGQVNKPGLVELTGPATLLELISKAGGLSKDAGETVTIKRTVNGKEEFISVDLKKLIESGASKDNISILSGDSVSVAKASVCYITGEIKKPGSYPCDSETTVLKMISLAGSFTGIASESNIKINRIVDGKKQLLEKVSLDTKVMPDDVIEVPESFF
jgi:polysaccharide export outer membrane protein